VLDDVWSGTILRRGETARVLGKCPTRSRECQQENDYKRIKRDQGEKAISLHFVVGVKTSDEKVFKKSGILRLIDAKNVAQKRSMTLMKF